MYVCFSVDQVIHVNHLGESVYQNIWLLLILVEKMNKHCYTCIVWTLHQGHCFFLILSKVKQQILHVKLSLL